MQLKLKSSPFKKSNPKYIENSNKLSSAKIKETMNKAASEKSMPQSQDRIIFGKNAERYPFTRLPVIFRVKLDKTKAAICRFLTRVIITTKYIDLYLHTLENIIFLFCTLNTL